MVFLYVGVLEKESVILDNVEKKTTKDMAPLSGCVHQLQVNIFFLMFNMYANFRSHFVWMCVHVTKDN